VQVAWIFHAFGTSVQLFGAGPRILLSEEEEVALVVATAFRESGIVVRENFGAIESFGKTPTGVRLNFSKNGTRASVETTLAVIAVGWVADTGALNLLRPASSLINVSTLRLTNTFKQLRPVSSRRGMSPDA
jgi:pyruvate/2-oxoglutarate dehydrogenase complex dihydrolipoamide dehydrogenase (E3) component